MRPPPSHIPLAYTSQKRASNIASDTPLGSQINGTTAAPKFAPIPSPAAKNAPYFTPEQDPVSGTALGTTTGARTPKRSTPLTVRGLTF
ncbi:hypothetical protein CTA2_4755 [Colletotrichum tanaceti]|uniref:Uncharacterized protein n=1 Tax=Colletotrichum tanaceti TaxID=1306861 RepID=A0A4V6DGJ0_9PEZI|nr:hypothetical protein CTA2_4755 [Colletotrichum tanaceti]TKW52956.1 hypothetical protein CTA1_3938 [Colletotrichum tanaceti]